MVDKEKERVRTKKDVDPQKKRRKKRKSRTKTSRGQRERIQSKDQRKSREPVRENKRKPAPKEEKTSALRKGISIVLQLIIYGFMLTIITVALLFTFSGDKHQSVFGYQFYNVLTNSMVPQKGDKQPNSFYAQDVIIVKKVPYKELEKGDVVTFAIGDGQAVLTHRLVEKKNKIGEREGNFLITKGDANPSQDPPIPGDKLIGKVVFVIPKVGLVIDFIRENILLCVVFAVSLLGSIYVLRNYFFN